MSDLTRMDTPGSLFEALERRVMLSYDPVTFPALADLASPDNTVVRFNTDLGFVDIELFDQAGPDGNAASAAPNTTANFLNYVLDGDYDGSFFHRLASLSGSGPAQIIQGGGFTFSAEDGLGEVPVDDPLANEFSDARSNVERSVAMAKILGDPDSATSQWFINLTDNSDALDDDPNVPDVPQFPGGPSDNGGFTVFGRIANDASWNVLQMMAGLDTFVFADVVVDENGDVVDPPGNDRFIPLDDPDANPLALALQETPVTGPVMEPGPNVLRSPLLDNDVLLDLPDAEVIKPAGSDDFYTRTIHFPEGFANDRIVEAITISNLDANEAVQYQVIVRYEVGQRDQVIATGTLEASALASVLVHDNSDNDAGVRTNTPFAYEVQATPAGGGIAGSLEHTDFGSTTGEQFVKPGNYTDDELTTWTFTTVEKRDGQVASFVVWQNLAETDAGVTARIYGPNQIGPHAILEFDTGAFRRGGINVGALDQIDDGVYAVVLTSDQPIVAAHSQYTNLPGFGAMMPTAQHAATNLGAAGEGNDSELIPFVTLTEAGTNEIRVFNPNQQSTLVTVLGSRADGSTFQVDNVLVPALTSRAVDLDPLIDNQIVNEGEVISFRLDSVPARPFHAQFRSVVDADLVSTIAVMETAQRISFSGVHYDPANPSGVVDTLSIFNPLVGAGNLIRYRVDVLFSNGDRITGSFQNLSPFNRVDLTVEDLPNAGAIIAKLNEDGIDPTFTLDIGFVNPSDTLIPVGIAQLSRSNTVDGFGWTTLGQPFGNEDPLDFGDGDGDGMEA